MEDFKLSTDPEKRFIQLEKIIQKGMAHFVEVGTALTIIRNERLYKDLFGNFEEYCKERWGFAKSYAYYLISSARTIKNLETSTIVDRPTHESQVRPLARLEPQQQARVWEKAVQTAPGKNITAKHVESVVKTTVENGIRQTVRPQTIDLDEEEPEDTPILKQLKKYWRMADRYEREIFIVWVREGKL